MHGASPCTLFLTSQATDEKSKKPGDPGKK